MSLPSRVGRDACELERRWALVPFLARNLVRMKDHFDKAFLPTGFPFPDIWIISGQRSERQNREAGGAPDSRHKRCPSEAVDLRIGNVEGLENLEVWAMLGGWWELNGGRWGGRFATPDPNHFDLG